MLWLEPFPGCSRLSLGSASVFQLFCFLLCAFVPLWFIFFSLSTLPQMNYASLIALRSSRINGSGIRQVFDRVEGLRASGKHLINLGIGQPDFTVPLPIKQAACDAIMQDHNGYMPTAGVHAFRRKAAEALAAEAGWSDLSVEKIGPGAADGGRNLMITAGTSGGLYLLLQAIVNAGDEVIIPDPYFVLYPYGVTLCDGKPVYCDTYPDFRMTAERVAPLITKRTKAVLLNSPGNPSGVVATQKECDDLAALCAERNIILIADEIYDKFTFSEGLENGVFPTPARSRGSENVVVIRGYGKTYGVTGWRLGYAAGPRAVIAEMMKLQQYSFVCAPSPLQHGAMAAMGMDMSEQIQAYAARRDIVLKHLSPLTECSVPHGAFYVFVKVPPRLGQTDRQFYERALEAGVVIIPGSVFSRRETHFRLSYTVPEDQLEKACAILAGLMK
jgi:aspartate/methionine/tyrosine aminotransferase